MSRQCHHKQPSGTRCRAHARRGSTFCFFHDPNSAAERHEARINGGRQRSRKATVLPPNTRDKPLTSASDISRLLEETINQVRRGELDPHVSNAVGYLASILLKANEREEFEQRLAHLESIISSHADRDVAASADHVTMEFVTPPNQGSHDVR
jgi:hypothetical protein